MLKILPKYFNAILNKLKCWEYRKDDRNFKVGDLLLLREFEANNYTGRTLTAKVTLNA